MCKTCLEISLLFINNNYSHGKESTKVRITQKIGKKKGNSHRKNEEISRQKAQTNIRKLN
jgi:hypothetical protein